MSIISSLLSPLINYMLSRESRIRKAQDDFISFRIKIIEAYGKYQTLDSFNGTPQEEAKKLRKEIIANCEALILCIKRISTSKGQDVEKVISNFMSCFTDDNFEKMIEKTSQYIHSFKS